MKKIIFLLPLMLLALSSCLNDDETIDYSQWKKDNEDFIAKTEAAMENGVKEYTRVSADWAPNDYVLMKWHNDRSLTAKNLRPLSNSTVDIKYDLENIEGSRIDSSYAQTTYGDSIYRSMPNENIVGMWMALTSMHVGDSVTLVVPYTSGYGVVGSGSVSPYSTLIFHVKLKDIPKYEK